MNISGWEMERREREVVALERIGTGLLRLAKAAEDRERREASQETEVAQ